jgi:phage terminase large subunit-like protein
LIDQKSTRSKKSSSKTSSRSSRTKLAKPAALSSFAATAEAYARDVVAGKVVACDWVKKACARHIADRKKEATKDFPYRWVPVSGNNACDFIEALPHTKDDFADRAQRGECLKLERWQIFIVCSLFAWRSLDGSRYRFREAYIEVPRKNGKSFLAAAIGLYKLAADGEFGAEVYSGATSEKQAWEIFRPARDIVARTADIRAALGITVNAKSLTVFKNGSRFEPIIGKPGDGASPSCALIDEYHEHTSDELVAAMRNGMGARKNPLLFLITTAGTDRSSACYSRHLDVKQILRGTVRNDRLFAIIFTIDEGDDWTSEIAVQKANPNYGVSVDPEAILYDQKAAMQAARLQADFKTKRLNIWLNTAVCWMNMVLWDACKDEHLKEERFEGQNCWLGLDFAAKIDIASSVRIYKEKDAENRDHYFAFHTPYLNEARATDPALDHYSQWALENRLVVTPGNETDYRRIADDVVNLAKKVRIVEIPHDPRDAQSFLQSIQERPDWDETVIFGEILQSKQNFTPPMRELEAAVAAKRFHFDGDPVLTWMISNVVVKPDSLEYLFPHKQNEKNKIDGAVAMLMAIGRAMLFKTEAFTSPDVFYA